MSRSELHPWRVLRSFVLELSSYEVPNVLDRAGLQVNWTLTKEQNFSGKMRIAAYRPRIDTAVEELGEEAQLRLAFVVAGELVARGHAERLESALGAIGWRLEDGKLAPSSRYLSELFFPPQTQHDAYVEIRGILQTARQSIQIVDPYIDQSVLTLVGAALQPGMSVQILSAKIPTDLPNEMKAWRAQHPAAALAVRTTREFHDRVVVLDGQRCWHIGCSIKDAGTKAFLLSKIEDSGNRDVLLNQFAASWANAS
ncbi:hypothetical protein ACVBEH_20760, partial [Roseateles sp. GG27B]